MAEVVAYFVLMVVDFQLKIKASIYNADFQPAGLGQHTFSFGLMPD